MAGVPEPVKTFLIAFAQSLQESGSSSTATINQFYDSQWSKINDRYFKTSEWPSVAAVSAFITGLPDATFLTLYEILYYVHHYTKLASSLTLEHRVASFKAYTKLFDWVLTQTQVPDLDLPSQWIWDLVDEFIYQYTEFAQYTHKVLREKSKSPKAEEDVNAIKANPSWWSVQTVLKYLDAFVTKANTLTVLAQECALPSAETKPGTFEHSPLYKNFGYFALIGLLRLHTLSGDYHSALKALSPISLNKRGLHTKVIAAYVSLYYYTGFVQMMTRRFPDAIRTFAHILQYVSRIKFFHTKSYQQDAIAKRTDHMYALLAILISFSPQRVDDTVGTILREKYSEKMANMARGDINPLEELFTFGSPKFISPALPSFDEESPANLNTELSRQQLKVFVKEISQQSHLPIIRSYLKLYTTIGLDKLANLLERKLDEDNLSKILMCYAHKSRVPADGDKGADLAFYIDNGMIHIVDAKAPRRYAEYFIRKSNNLDEIISDLQTAQ